MIVLIVKKYSSKYWSVFSLLLETSKETVSTYIAQSFTILTMNDVTIELVFLYIPNNLEGFMTIF